MATKAFSQYLGAVKSAIDSSNGEKLRDLMGINNPLAMQGIFEAQQTNPRWDPESPCSSRLPSPWDEVFAAHCRCLAALLKGRRAEAYDHISQATIPFLRAFRADTSAWCIDPMFGVIHNVRNVAVTADKELVQAGKKSTKLSNAGQILQQCFSAALQAQGSKAKRYAALEVVNTLFKIYFSLNTLRLCKNLIKSVHSPQFLPFDQFPLGQRVTYKFYVGRLAVFDEDYPRAKADLLFAFNNCDPNATRNIQLILKYLIPVQLVLGILPHQSLLTNHSLGVFSDIVDAMKTGSVRKFKNCMEENQDVFIQSGTFLLLEKLKLTLYRRLFRKVVAIHKEMDPAKASQIPLGMYQGALKWEGIDMDLDEVECILANLIYRKYIKGYISHQHRVMVISKADPFPPLSKINLVDIA